MSIKEFNRLFAAPNESLPEDVLNELSSILRLHSLPEQELFYKWEAYSMKLGGDNSQLNYKNVRDFKKDLQDTLEREAKGRAQVPSANKKAVNYTPKPANGSDVYGVLDGLVSGTPAARGSVKRRNDFETPTSKSTKVDAKGSPRNVPASSASETKQTSFADRPDPGKVIETVNEHLDVMTGADITPTESRVKLKANADISKYAYKTMYMKLSEASEVLDERIDEFTLLVQQHHGFPESAFGNPAARSTSEIITVGRIASDSDGSINAASLTLEPSRRMGAGLRVPLKVDGLACDLFPGKIVALRGINASGESFKASEVIKLPLQSLTASKSEELDVHNARLAGTNASESEHIRPLSLIIASGPYTTDTDLSFSALHALLDRATEAKPDVIILNGPFLDAEHPLIASGEFDLPKASGSDGGSLEDAFRQFISQPLSRFASQSPTTTIILVPSVRDSVLKHTSWPQDRFSKKDLGLPKQVTCVTNPITLSINELVVCISSQDVLYEMQRQLVSQGNKNVADDLLMRLIGCLLEQRHFFPVFPPLDPEKLPRPTPFRVNTDALGDAAQEAASQRVAVGACLDTAYLKLGEFIVRPDLLITPSVLPPFAKIVDSVVAINPGTLSKRRAAGTFAELKILPRRVREEEKEANVLGHELFNRARIDIVRI